jgi:hypothetical protein
MPNQFNGQVFDSNGKKLSGVKVTITSPTIPSGTSTTTDINGNWLITIKTNIDSKDVTVTFSKSGLETTSVTNPQQTAILPGYIDPEKGGTLDLAGDYPSGKWKITSLPQEMQDIINKEIEDAYTFAKNNPGTFRLEIESSESQVPNADNEGTGKNFSKPGSLANARAEALQEYINVKINTLYIKETNPLFQKPTVVLGKVDRVGDESWDKVDANANKYTKDQYTRLKANFIKLCDWVNLENLTEAGEFKPITGIGASNIELDAAVAPDVFIIKGKIANGTYIEKQTPTFIQHPGSAANPIGWGILAYMADITNNSLNQYITPLQKQTIDLNTAVRFISEGYSQDKSNTFSNNIIQLFNKKNVNIPLNTTFEFRESQLLTGLKAYFPNGEVTYYIVDRSYYKFPLTQNGITGDFEVKAIKGTFAGGSAFRYKMCK